MHDIIMSSIEQYLNNNNDNRKFLVGLTDYKNKRYRNKTGWLWSDGSSMTNTALWFWTEPNNGYNSEDCGLITKTGLHDIQCHHKNLFICQMKAKSTRSGYFKIQSNKLAQVVPKVLKCTTASIKFCSVLRCGMHCAAQPLASCFAFYYNKMNGSCVLVPYLDVTLLIERQQHWVKYVSVP